MNYRCSNTVNVLPRPGLLLSSTEPLWDSAIHLTIERPSPKPPFCRERAWSAPVEPLENVGCVLRWNSDSSVGNLNAQRAGRIFHLELHAPALRRISDSVLEQIQNQSPDR